MVDENKGKIESGVILNDVYFLKVGRIRYLKSKSYKKNCCQICGKKKKTTAHHIIPKRLRCICPYLAEIRVRVCADCDEQFHPENKFIKESDIVKRQSKKISRLQEDIKDRDSKVRRLVKGIKEVGVNATLLLILGEGMVNIVKDKKTGQKEPVRDRQRAKLESDKACQPFLGKKEVNKDDKKQS